MPKPNKHHQPAVTRIVIKGADFVDSVAASRCRPDEQVALVIVNTDPTEYVLKMTGFKNKGAKSAVNEGDLFVSVSSSIHIKKSDATVIQRTVKDPTNWGTAAGQFPYTTYEFTLQLFDKSGTTLLNELDPDYDITP